MSIPSCFIGVLQEKCIIIGLNWANGASTAGTYVRNFISHSLKWGALVLMKFLLRQLSIHTTWPPASRITNELFITIPTRRDFSSLRCIKSENEGHRILSAELNKYFRRSGHNSGKGQIRFRSNFARETEGKRESRKRRTHIKAPVIAVLSQLRYAPRT